MAKRSKITAKTPYTKSMLPHNRRELFFDVVKLNYIQLICMGLVLFAFAVPLIVNVLVSDFYTAQISGAIDTAEASEQILSELVVVKNTSALISIPLLGILFVGISGMLRVIRQYAWGEVVFPYRDFTIGIKQNVKQTVILGLTIGVVIAVCTYLQSLADMNDNISAYHASSAAGVVSILFLLPVGGYSLVCISVYGNSFVQNLLQGFVLYMKQPIKTILAATLCFGIYFFLMMPNAVVRFGILVGGILLFPFILLAWFLFAFDQLDQYVNAEKHPDIVNKGLFFDDTE